MNTRSNTMGDDQITNATTTVTRTYHVTDTTAPIWTQITVIIGAGVSVKR